MTNRLFSILGRVWLLITLILAIYVFYALAIQDRKQFDILAMLPQDQSHRLFEANQLLEDSKATNQFVILLGHPNPAIAQKALKTLCGLSTKKTNYLNVALETAHQVSEEQMKFFKALYPYRAGLLSESDRQALRSKTPQTLIKAALIDLSGPAGGMDIKGDPLSLFSRFARDAFPSSSLKITETGDLFIETEGKTWFIYRATLPDSPFSFKTQENLLKKLTPYLTQFTAEGIDVLRAGAVFYAAAGAQSAQKDISLIGFLSMLGIILMMFAVFRTLRPLLFAISVIGVGIVVGITACLVIFGSIHIIALVFGCSLVGITVDYAIHYTCAAFHKTPEKTTLHTLMPALPLGMLSSALGYGLLLFVPFPGIQQMALLACVGLIGAFITVVLWGEVFFKHAKRIQSTGSFIQNGLEKIAKITCHGPIQSLIGIALIICFALGMIPLRFDDTLQGLQTLNPTLKAQEEKIQKLTQFKNPTQFLTISARTLEELLQIEEKIGEELSHQGLSCRSLAQLIPSQKRQKENRQLVQTFYQTHFVTFKKLIGYETAPDADFGFKAALLDFNSIELPKSFKPLLHVSQTLTGRIFPSKELDPILISQILSTYPEADYIDTHKEYSYLFETYRQLVLGLVFAVFAGIMVLLGLRTGPKSALSIIVPVALSLLASFGIMGMLMPINLFHIMGLLMTLCIGIDYALFLYWREPKGKGDLLLLGNSLAAMTTILSFGLLMFSETTAVKSFGLSVFIGILLCFCTTLIFLGHRENRHASDA